MYANLSVHILTRSHIGIFVLCLYFSSKVTMLKISKVVGEVDFS